VAAALSSPFSKKFSATQPAAAQTSAGCVDYSHMS